MSVLLWEIGSISNNKAPSCKRRARFDRPRPEQGFAPAGTLESAGSR